jgi:hypothetical protein
MGNSKSWYLAIYKESIVESATDEGIVFEVQVAIKINRVDEASELVCGRVS